jgi:hypothetical protein
MSRETYLTLFLIGAAIGLALALAGAVAEYWSSLRPKSSSTQQRLPGCLLYAAGGLGLAGIIAIIASFILSGGIIPALIMGAGVLGGFYTTFAFLFIVWVILERQK